jgi:hypothetical protein
MKLVVHYKDGIKKEIQMEPVRIIPGPDNAPIVLDLHSTRNGTLMGHISSNIFPGEEFLDKIEIVQ